MLQIFLLSQSPRRYQLLTEAGYDIRVDSVKVSEIIDKNLNLPEAFMAVAESKLEAYLQSVKVLNSNRYLFLSADTAVVFKDRLLGKPQDSVQAAEFLGLLSGRVHQVFTAICLQHGPTGLRLGRVDKTSVQMKVLTEQEIQDYIATGEPLDKAGAYGIQGLGGNLVESIQGSWSNVVGLPMELLERTINEQGWRVYRK